MEKKELIKKMLESAVHFGHRAHKWNPKMKKYLYGQRKGIHIFDLEKTYDCLSEALGFVKKLISEGRTILFVGTKPQALKILMEAAETCKMPFVVHKWMGGLLTNYSTIKKRIEYLKKLKAQDASGELDSKYKKKEALELRKQVEKLEAALGGLSDITGLPDALFIVDSIRDNIAIKEAKRLGIPVIAIVDSNGDPSEVTYVLPGNDDAINSIKFFTDEVSNVILEVKKHKIAKK